MLLENLLLDIRVERSRRSPKLLNRVLVVASDAVLRRERGAEQFLSVVLKTKWNTLPEKCHFNSVRKQRSFPSSAFCSEVDQKIREECEAEKREQVGAEMICRKTPFCFGSDESLQLGFQSRELSYHHRRLTAP